MFKQAIGIIGALSLTAFASVGQANYQALYGDVESSTGAIAGLIEEGTEVWGYLDWNFENETLDGAQVLLGGFCFTDDASGVPPTSGTCGALSAVPILPTGETVYDGTQAPAGSTFEQAGSDFYYGTTNILATLTAFNTYADIALMPYAWTYGIIDPCYNPEGEEGEGPCYENPAGSFFIDAGALGAISGRLWADFSCLSCDPFPTRPIVTPIPAAAWLFGSALLGLGLVKRKQT